MNLAAAALLFLVSLAAALAGATRVGAWMIERRNPPVGSFAEAGTNVPTGLLKIRRSS